MHKYSKLYYDSKDTSDLKSKAQYFLEIFKGYSKTYIKVAEFDRLHDDEVSFYKKLEKSHIEYSLTEVNGVRHGDDFKIKSNLVKNLIKERLKFCK